MGRVGYFDAAAHPTAWADPAWVAIAWFDPDYLELGAAPPPLPFPGTTFRTRGPVRVPESTREALFRTRLGPVTFVAMESSP